MPVEITVKYNNNIKTDILAFAGQLTKTGIEAAIITAQAAIDKHSANNDPNRQYSSRSFGQLRDSLSKAIPIPNGYKIQHDLQIAPHTLFVHWGTKPHEIKPNKKKVLRWAKSGVFHFAKKVNHPGYAGDPWLIHARDDAVTAIQDYVNKLG